MPTSIPWDENTLKALASNPETRIFCDQKKISVVLQPFHLQNLKSAVRELLNASVDSYDKSLDGVLLSYRHLKVLSNSASVGAETSGVSIEISADFYVFRPQVGCVLEGVVNKISKDHVGILLYQRFNVSCPRPSSEGKSEKWLGNNVCMNQEVVFKLKAKDFSGRLPFFRGKIISCGRVMSEVLDGESKKSKKKKKKDQQQESANVFESSSTSIPQTKILKHKLKESEENSEVKKKKNKKEINTMDMNSHAEVTSETMSSKKKAKRVSISTGEDFIPRFSLDVSQLPEDLPPPNADSTHFDIGKNLSSLSNKKEKKKNRSHNSLSLISEETSQGAKGTSLEISARDGHSGVEKVKKKKDKREKKDKIVSDHTSHEQLTPKDTDVQSSRMQPPHLEPEAHSLPHGSRKRKEKSGIKEDSPTKDKRSKKAKVDMSSSNSISIVNLDERPVLDVINSSEMQTDDPTPSKQKKKHKLPIEDEVLPPSKQKKEKKQKGTLHAEEAVISGETSHKLPVEDKFLSPTKHKKEKKQKGTLQAEEAVKSAETSHKLHVKDKFLSPTKHKKEKKGKGSSPNEEAITSDETIPPGQKVVSNQVKQVSVSSPKRNLSTNIGKSTGIGYFSGSSSMLDLDLGTRKGARPAPLTFGNFEGKVLPPPESPIKATSCKKQTSDSDSDSPPPKKVILSTSIKKKTNESDSSDEDVSKVNSPSKSNRSFVRRDSDDSDYEDIVQNKILQSLGILSPQKKNKPQMKLDDSDSDSDYASKPPVSIPNSAPKTPQKSILKKPMSPKNDAVVSKKDSQISKPLTGKPSKNKGAVIPASLSSPKSKGKSSPESDDSDLELMRSALLQERQNSALPKSKLSKGKVAASKPVGSVEEELNVKIALPIKHKQASKQATAKSLKGSEISATSAKPLKGNDKTQKITVPAKKTKEPAKPVAQPKGKVKSASATNLDDSGDSDLELMKTAMQVLEEEKKTGKKILPSRNPKLKVLSKKLSVTAPPDLDDSDSGPDDRNTTAQMEEHRRKQASESFKKPPLKERKLLQPNDKTNSKVSKPQTKKVFSESSKTQVSKSDSSVKESAKKKREKHGEQKGKVDSDITDLMQKLLNQRNKELGLA